ncbi:MAG TPA: signal peptidase I [Ktedonobacterales bacterium]
MSTHLVPTPRAPRQRPQAAGAQNRFMREFVETVLLTLLVYLVVRASVQFTPIEGPSMEPWLHAPDSAIVNQLAYIFSSPQRGDVIVLHPPDDPSTQYIKRIIAIPGDSIELSANSVIVNGVTLHETYVNPADNSPNENGPILGPTHLGPGQYFVMGDNRGDSSDSRVFGAVPRQNIVGKAEVIIWPFDQLHFIPTYHEVYAGLK